MNDAIVIDFTERDSGRGVDPHNLSTIGGALGQALSAFAPPGADECKVLLLAVEPGSLRLVFRAAKKEWDKAPAAITLAGMSAWEPLYHAARGLVDALIGLGMAVMLPPAASQGIEPPALSKGQSRACEVLFVSLRQTETQAIVIRAPDCPSIALSQAQTPGYVIIQSSAPLADHTPNLRYSGPVRLLHRLEAMQLNGQPVIAFIGSLDAEEQSPQRIALVLWPVDEQEPSASIKWDISGVLHGPDDGPRHLNLTSTRPPGSAARVEADAILVVERAKIRGI